MKIITKNGVAIYNLPDNYSLTFDIDGYLRLPNGTRVSDVLEADFEGGSPACVLYPDVDDVPEDWTGGKYAYDGVWSEVI